MLKSTSHGISESPGPISALGVFVPRADVGTLGLIDHETLILARVIMYLSHEFYHINKKENM
jgi:hypothetical protein